MAVKANKGLSKCLKNAKMKFGEHHNTMYDMNQFMVILLEMAKSGITAQAAAADLRKKNMPSGKWFRNMVNSISIEDGLNACRELTHSSMKDDRKRTNEPRLVAIDKHKIPRNDKDDTDELIRSKPKDGTSKFQVCASMQAVGGETNLILDWVPVKKATKTRILCVTSCVFCHGAA